MKWSMAIELSAISLHMWLLKSQLGFHVDGLVMNQSMIMDMFCLRELDKLLE